MHRTGAVCLLLATCVLHGWAQTSALPPLMYFRFAGPPGTKVTIYRNARGATFEAPFVVGLRPGYVYRMQVDNIPNHPGLQLFPSIEVRGSLQLHMRTRNADFPASIWLHDEDIAAVRAGTLLTKVVVLEHPDTALPTASRVDQPVEIPVALQRNPLEEAALRGKALAIVQLGKRQFTPAELAAEAIPGTVLLPGEKVLGQPALPPQITSQCYPLIDPVAGPDNMIRDTTLYDGGDSGPVAGYSRGKLRGVNPSDVVAEYVDAFGNKRVSASNRVGVLTPRFVIIRGETLLAENTTPIVLAAKNSVTSRDVIRGRDVAETYNQHQHLDTLKGRERLSSNMHITGITITGRVDGLQRFVVLNPGVTSITALSPGAVAAKQPAPDRPLKIDKWPDKLVAQVGDIVLFTIRYTNPGGSVIRDIVLHEDLTTRFEYVPGSAKSDREANFTTRSNDAGSHHLQWDLPGVLAPGESGIVEFEVRVR